jgi:hypothetical protein
MQPVQQPHLVRDRLGLFLGSISFFLGVVGNLLGSLLRSFLGFFDPVRSPLGFLPCIVSSPLGFPLGVFRGFVRSFVEVFPSVGNSVLGFVQRSRHLEPAATELLQSASLDPRGVTVRAAFERQNFETRGFSLDIYRVWVCNQAPVSCGSGGVNVQSPAGRAGLNAATRTTASRAPSAARDEEIMMARWRLIWIDARCCAVRMGGEGQRCLRGANVLVL